VFEEAVVHIRHETLDQHLQQKGGSEGGDGGGKGARRDMSQCDGVGRWEGWVDLERGDMNCKSVNILHKTVAGSSALYL
jgi:hypothetical protein